MEPGKGIDAPNYTQTPNLFYDEWMAVMECTEFKVVAAIIRQTFGWHKDRDRISLSQLEKVTGLSRQGVIDGVTAGMARGIIDREPEGDSFSYAVVVNSVDQSAGDRSNELTSTSQLSRPALVNSVDTQKKGKKQKEKDSGADAPERTLYEWLQDKVANIQAAVQQGLIFECEWKTLLVREKNGCNKGGKPRKTLVEFLERQIKPQSRERNPLFDAVALRVYNAQPGSPEEADVAGRVGKSMQALRTAQATLKEFHAACDWYHDRGLSPPRDERTGQLIRDYRASHSHNGTDSEKSYWSGQSRAEILAQLEQEQTPA